MTRQVMGFEVPRIWCWNPCRHLLGWRGRLGKRPALADTVRCRVLVDIFSRQAWYPVTIGARYVYLYPCLTCLPSSRNLLLRTHVPFIMDTLPLPLVSADHDCCYQTLPSTLDRGGYLCHFGRFRAVNGTRSSMTRNQGTCDGSAPES